MKIRNTLRNWPLSWPIVAIGEITILNNSLERRFLVERNFECRSAFLVAAAISKVF